MGMITTPIMRADGAAPGGFTITDEPDPRAYGLAVSLEGDAEVNAVDWTDFYDGTIVFEQVAGKMYRVHNGLLLPITGAQGPKGDKGDPGPQGPKGDTGAQGPVSKFQFARATGLSAGNIGNGEVRLVGSIGVGLIAAFASDVTVWWMNPWSGSAAAGRLWQQIRRNAGCAEVMAVNQSYTAGEYASSFVLGSFAAAPGADLRCDLYSQVNGASANVNISGGIAVMIVIPT